MERKCGPDHGDVRRRTGAHDHGAMRWSYSVDLEAVRRMALARSGLSHREGLASSAHAFGHGCSEGFG